MELGLEEAECFYICSESAYDSVAYDPVRK